MVIYGLVRTDIARNAEGFKPLLSITIRDGCAFGEIVLLPFPKNFCRRLQNNLKNILIAKT